MPQGREQSAAAVVVTVTSNGTCDVYAANQDVNGNWVTSGDKLDSLKVIQISAAKLQKLRRTMRLSSAAQAFYYKCAAPFIVRRPVPLVSYEYSGDFVAYIDQKRVQIVNVVDPDTYLKGVIPAEMPATWPTEVLKVQAVAARTYAWWSVIAARANLANYDMDDTVQYQAYLGNSNRTRATDEASQATAGIIIKYQGQPIKAYFSADSGGYTESAKAVFGAALRYCVAQPELYNVTHTVRPTEWNKSFALDELQKALSSILPRGIKIADVTVSERNESGRIQKLTLLGTNGKSYSIPGPQFRYATQIRSTLFELAKNGANYVLSGKGSGHGVGMAQIGAMAYADQFGWTYDKILKFYYPETVLEQQ